MAIGMSSTIQLTQPQLPPVDLDRLMTVEEFAVWRRVSVDWVRRRKGRLPGRISQSRKDWVIHPRAYLAAMVEPKRKARR